MKALQRTVGFRSDWPTAAKLDLIRANWSPLLTRDIAVFGKRQNKDLQEVGESIPTNVLANRLQALVASGLIAKRMCQYNPPRNAYFLADAGNVWCL